MERRPAPLTADKTLPRKSIVLMMNADTAASVNVPSLPDGYTFRTYMDGDDLNWARLMVRVDEYNKIEDAVEGFHRTFGYDPASLAERVVFIVSPEGDVVATSAAWWFEENGIRYGRLHWVASDPDHQNKGLGRAVVSWSIHRLSLLETGRTLYLDTQTWSHKAIGLYQRLGFRPVRRTHPVLLPANEYDEALEILRDVLPEASLAAFENAAIS